MTLFKDYKLHNISQEGPGWKCSPSLLFFMLCYVFGKMVLTLPLHALQDARFRSGGQFMVQSSSSKYIVFFGIFQAALVPSSSSKDVVFFSIFKQLWFQAPAPRMLSSSAYSSSFGSKLQLQACHCLLAHSEHSFMWFQAPAQV